MKIKKARLNQDTVDIYLANKNKNPYLVNNSTSIKSKYDYETLKNLTRKSIDNNTIKVSPNGKNNTVVYAGNQLIKPFKRISHNFRKSVAVRRYD
jgi:hypothetical protein